MPRRGLVPDLIEWEYYFHGGGCCLTHRVSGEALDVDFHDDSAEFIEVWFYLQYLKSLPAPQPPERRLLELHPSFEAIDLAIEDLRGEGILEGEPGRSIFRLSQETIEHAEAIEGFCSEWEVPERRVWLGALIGDWPAAQRVRLPAVDRLIQRSAEACRQRRQEYLHEAFENVTKRCEGLWGIADLDRVLLKRYLERIVESAEPDGTLSSAIYLVGESKDPAWCPAVYRLFRRLDPNGSLPQPHQWTCCAEFLLTHKVRTSEVLARRPLMQQHQVGSVALLALEHAPRLALPLFRRALRSEIPHNRITAAAVLAILDRPWGREELMAVLRESTDQERTAECRAALWNSHDAQARQAASRWEEQNPHEPEQGEGITMRDMSLLHCERYLLFEMEQYHERVLRLREVSPTS